MWLFGIARNLILNAERTDQRRLRLVDRLKALPDGSAAPASDDGADVRDAVQRLGPDTAELVRLIHWEGSPSPKRHRSSRYPLQPRGVATNERKHNFGWR